MKTLLPYVFFASICGAFLLNLYFLGAAAAGWAARAGRKKAAAGLLTLLAVLFAWSAAWRAVPPRGGYDNEHDISYLCMSVFSRSGPLQLLHGKEASPLVADAVADALSGFSLAAVPVKNRLLLFASAVLFFAGALRAGLGLPAALLAFLLYAFSFLAGLNANTFSTTPANLFFLASAVYAALALEAGRTGTRGLLWAASSLFLVWTSRYELAVFPALVLLFSLAAPGGGARAALGGRGRLPGLGVLLLTALLCLAWGRVALLAGYNGPAPGQALRFLDNLGHHLDEKNLALFFPAAAGLAPWGALTALLVSLAGAFRGGRRALLAWSLLAAACLYAAAIFSSRELYPLQFMRHQLYFYVPYIALFAAATAAARRLQLPAAAAAAKWLLLAAVCVAYAWANILAAAALGTEKRTNDREWTVLLEAARKWPAGCVFIYPSDDNRGLLLRKYFPAYDPRREPAPACLLKYVPPSTADFRPRAAPPPQKYNQFSVVYAAAAGRALAAAEFPHDFYTVWEELETRARRPVKAGFYPADSRADAAWVKSEKGLDLLRERNFPEAERRFREAAALFPGCDVCRTNLAVTLLALGRRREALLLVGEGLERAGGEAERQLLLGLGAAALGHREEALKRFAVVGGYYSSGRFPAMSHEYARLVVEALP